MVLGFSNTKLEARELGQVRVFYCLKKRKGALKKESFLSTNIEKTIMYNDVIDVFIYSSSKYIAFPVLFFYYSFNLNVFTW
jgi:hypothetical protein